MIRRIRFRVWAWRAMRRFGAPNTAENRRHLAHWAEAESWGSE